jgi:hypothetical protein
MIYPCQQLIPHERISMDQLIQILLNIDHLAEEEVIRLLYLLFTGGLCSNDLSITNLDGFLNAGFVGDFGDETSRELRIYSNIYSLNLDVSDS